MKWADSTYVGDFKDGLAHGRGKVTFDDGSTYEGDWLDDKKHGKGKYIYNDGSMYEGDWLDDQRHGQGKVTYDDGSTYEGDFKDDKKHGKGKYTYNDGSTYEGDWLDGKKHGTGIRTYNDGSTYEGEWEHDKKHGKGKYTYPDDKFYEGDWLSDQRHGQGKVTYDNDDVYEGEWDHDVIHGQGKYAYANGNLYEGEFKNDEINGQGKMTYADGSTYEGEWLNGIRHGTGIQRYNDGSVYNGLWNNGIENPLFVDGVLADNEEYDPDSLRPVVFPIASIELPYGQTGYDMFDLEDKKIWHELQKPNSFVIGMNGTYHVTSIVNIAMQMNDKNNIKYECTREYPVPDGHPRFSLDADVNKAVPYLSMNSVCMIQGLVPLFELWSAIQSGHNAYQLVPIKKIEFIASHHTAYQYGTWISSDHCQRGAPQQVYALVMLDVQFNLRDKSAHKIQNAMRGRKARKTVRRERREPERGESRKRLKTS